MPLLTHEELVPLDELSNATLPDRGVARREIRARELAAAATALGVALYFFGGSATKPSPTGRLARSRPPWPPIVRPLPRAPADADHAHAPRDPRAEGAASSRWRSGTAAASTSSGQRPPRLRRLRRPAPPASAATPRADCHSSLSSAVRTTRSSRRLRRGVLLMARSGSGLGVAASGEPRCSSRLPPLASA
jgi:LmbE family N-acetylglucosaminyl deacetylase